MIQVTSQTVQTTQDLVRLFWHESQRVFEDRLVSSEDCSLVESLIETSLQESFQVGFQEIQNSDQLLYSSIRLRYQKHSGYQ